MDLQELFDAVESGDTDAVCDVLNYGDVDPDTIIKTPIIYSETSILIAAVMSKNIDMVRMVLDAGANPNIVVQDGITALWVSIDYVQCDDITQVLLDAGASVHAGTEPIFGRAIFVAVPESIAIHMIYDGADVNQEFDGVTPLDSALEYDYSLEFIKFLIEAGADPDARSGWRKRLILEIALTYELHSEFILSVCSLESLCEVFTMVGDRETIEYMISRGVPVDHIDSDGGTVLFGAVNGNCIDTVKWLLDFGIPVNCYDKCGRSALSYCRSTDIAKILVAAGAEINTRDMSGKHTLLCHLVHSDRYDIIQVLLHDTPRLVPACCNYLPNKKPNGRYITEYCKLISAGVKWSKMQPFINKVMKLHCTAECVQLIYELTQRVQNINNCQRRKLRQTLFEWSMRSGSHTAYPRTAEYMSKLIVDYSRSNHPVRKDRQNVIDMLQTLGAPAAIAERILECV